VLEHPATGYRQAPVRESEDVDFDGGFVRARKQLDRAGDRVEPKTEEAVRGVVMVAALGKLLREHKAASGYSQEGDFVFCTRDGKPLQHRNVSRAFGAVATRAGLNEGRSGA